MFNFYLFKYRLQNRDNLLILKLKLINFFAILIILAPVIYFMKPFTYIKNKITVANTNTEILDLQTEISVNTLADSNKIININQNTDNKVLTPLNGVLTNNYGNGHTGVDIQGKHHDNIIVIDNGTVTFAGSQNGYGNCIEVCHGEYYSFYAHLSKIYVSKGQNVSKGDIIGLEGGAKTDPNPGYSTGHHLHFEIRYASGYGNDVNPFNNKWFKLVL